MKSIEPHPLLGDAKQAASAPFVPLHPVLTYREAQVARAVCYGWPQKRIAIELGISLKTVQKHHQNVNYKIGGSGIAALIHWSLRNNILSPTAYLALPKLPS